MCERYESLSRRHVSELFTHHKLTTAKEDMMAHIESNRLQHMHRYWCAANYLTIGQIYLQENPLLREPLQAGTHQAPVAGTLGNLAWPQLHLRAPEPPDPGHGCQRDLPDRPGTRRPRDRRERLPGRDLLRDLSARRAGRRGPAAPLPPVLDAGRHPEPRQRADPWLYARGRRTRLCPHARFRRCLR